MPYKPRGRGQIPPYGKNFRHDRTSYHPSLASTVYVLKRDAAWFIRSDKTSHAWTIYWRVPGTGASYDTATAMGKPHRTLTLAMDKLLAGIEGGFYPAAG